MKKLIILLILLSSSIASAAKFVPGKGLALKSDNDKFNLVTRVRAQFLYDLLQEENEWIQALQIRRARLQFLGHAFNKHNKFKIELAFSPKDLGIKDSTVTKSPLLSWYGEFDYFQNVTLRLGQYKVPFSRQRVISSGNLQMVDRSIVNAEFNLDRDVGLDLRSKNLFGLNCLKYYTGIYMGEGRDAFAAGSFDFMYIARLEVLPFGMFKDYSEADFTRSKKLRVSFGVAYAYVDEAKKNRGIIGSTPKDGGTTDTHNVTADLMAKWSGVSLHSAFMLRTGVRKYGSDGDEEKPRNGYGISNQIGFMLKDIPVEISTRYSFIRPILNSSMTENNELGGAISYYFAQHPLKLQVDYFRLWTKNSSDGDDQIRAQLQLAL